MFACRGRSGGGGPLGMLSGVPAQISLQVTNALAVFRVLGARLYLALVFTFTLTDLLLPLDMQLLGGPLGGSPRVCSQPTGELPGGEIRKGDSKIAISPTKLAL